MAKPVKIRIHYTEDAQFMLRLKKAVLKDNRPQEWKEDVSKKLTEISVLLLQAPPKEA